MQSCQATQFATKRQTEIQVAFIRHGSDWGRHASCMAKWVLCFQVPAPPYSSACHGVPSVWELVLHCCRHFASLNYTTRTAHAHNWWEDRRSIVKMSFHGNYSARLWRQQWPVRSDCDDDDDDPCAFSRVFGRQLVRHTTSRFIGIIQLSSPQFISTALQ
jgi:hypothetical protein